MADTKKPTKKDVQLDVFSDLLNNLREKQKLEELVAKGKNGPIENLLTKKQGAIRLNLEMLKKVDPIQYDFIKKQMEERKTDMMNIAKARNELAQFIAQEQNIPVKEAMNLADKEIKNAEEAQLRKITKRVAGKALIGGITGGAGLALSTADALAGTEDVGAPEIPRKMSIPEYKAISEEIQGKSAKDLAEMIEQNRIYGTSKYKLPKELETPTTMDEKTKAVLSKKFGSLEGSYIDPKTKEFVQEQMKKPGASLQFYARNPEKNIRLESGKLYAIDPITQERKEISIDQTGPIKFTDEQIQSAYSISHPEEMKALKPRQQEELYRQWASKQGMLEKAEQKAREEESPILEGMRKIFSPNYQEGGLVSDEISAKALARDLAERKLRQYYPTRESTYTKEMLGENPNINVFYPDNAEIPRNIQGQEYTEPQDEEGLINTYYPDETIDESNKYPQKSSEPVKFNSQELRELAGLRAQNGAIASPEEMSQRIRNIYWNNPEEIDESYLIPDKRVPPVSLVPTDEYIKLKELEKQTEIANRLRELKHERSLPPRSSGEILDEEENPPKTKTERAYKDYQLKIRNLSREANYEDGGMVQTPSTVHETIVNNYKQKLIEQGASEQDLKNFEDIVFKETKYRCGGIAKKKYACGGKVKKYADGGKIKVDLPEASRDIPENEFLANAKRVSNKPIVDEDPMVSKLKQRIKSAELIDQSLDREIAKNEMLKSKVAPETINAIEENQAKLREVKAVNAINKEGLFDGLAKAMMKPGVKKTMLNSVAALGTGLSVLGSAPVMAGTEILSSEDVGQGSDVVPNMDYNALEKMRSLVESKMPEPSLPKLKYKDGGISDKELACILNDRTVPGTSYVGDKVKANVNSGELISNLAEQQKMKDGLNGEHNSEFIGHRVDEEVNSGKKVINTEAQKKLFDYLRGQEKTPPKEDIVREPTKEETNLHEKIVEQDKEIKKMKEILGIRG